jgi:hypothetical protein
MNQFKLFIIYQMFEIYHKLFNHFNQARFKLSRKKVSWKRIMLKNLIATNAKFRPYYSKTQDSLNCLYKKTTLLSSNKKNAMFQDSNWKIENDETFWNEIYWKTLKEQFFEKYHDKSKSNSRSKQSFRIDDLNLLLSIDTSSFFAESQDDLNLYRKRDESTMIWIKQHELM